MTTITECFTKYHNYSNTWCPPVHDSWLCWPPTPPDSRVELPCPEIEGGSETGKAFRLCGENGTWKGKTPDSNTSYTNFTDCLLGPVQDLAQLCDRIQGCDNITENTRIIEMVGLSFSLLALLPSLYIFLQYSVLKNNRTRIHKNLFVATLLQVFVRLIMYMDQEFPKEHRFIARTPYLDEMCKSFLEYTKTAMFMWMFIEGLYLHNMVTFTVFREYPNIRLLFYIGWTVPTIMTLAWVITMIVVKRSWSYYYFLPYYWILEGPRLILMVVNLLFLINIIRVLVVKLYESHTTEIELVRKAVRAAIFLLPLMGTPNILFYISYDKFTEAWQFALWSYVSYFLTSFQGFFVAVLYCFLNGEVQTALKNAIMLRMSLRNHEYTPCRNLTVISTTNEPELHQATLNYGGSPRWISRCLKQLNKSVIAGPSLENSSISFPREYGKENNDTTITNSETNV